MQRSLKAGALALGATVALLLAAPAQAQIFHDDDDGWCLWCFHRYGDGDVNRPGRTPDRPYWHGDDAVPLGMRWQDLEAARAEAAAEDAAAAAAAAAVEASAPVHRRRYAVRRRTVHRVVSGPVLVRKD
jgi:hypothetical protein